MNNIDSKAAAASDQASDFVSAMPIVIFWRAVSAALKSTNSRRTRVVTLQPSNR
jgi:hypothetical protein